MQTKDLIEQGRQLIKKNNGVSDTLLLTNTDMLALADYAFEYLPEILDRLEKRTKACEFYGDDKNWDGCDDTYTVADVEAWKDYGKLAREAMADEEVKGE